MTLTLSQAARILRRADLNAFRHGTPRPVTLPQRRMHVVGRAH